MTSHEKTIELISNLGISVKKIAEILGVGESTVHKKINMLQRNKFNDDNYSKIFNHCKSVIEKIP
ncbi:hypothetical protein [Chryseobacterium arthrosphaerae]|uniref:hypothetical protein n=1 Tax=Chryseobacterium arthrosphaerae TaxID=651561 RepID=UPI0031D2B62F